MKRVVLAIIAVLVVIALPAAAQYSDQAAPATTQPTTTTATEPETTTATEETTTTGQPMEQRTNPVVPTHGSDAGLSASGSVVSANAEEIVLNSNTGDLHFKLLPNTTGTTAVNVGDRLTIDFTRNEHGVLLAKQVRPESTTATMPQGITTPGAAAAGEKVEAAAENVAEAVDEGVEETLQADIDGDEEIGERGDTTSSETDSLPATGSSSPLLALLGLLAIGGAVALRRS